MLNWKKRKGNNYERMCLGCRQFRNKNYLVRIANLKDGRIIIDDAKKLGGRGAYVCPIFDCAIAMVKKRSLFHSLKRNLKLSDIKELLSELKNHMLWISGDLKRLW
ncbi:MAG: YlxR family protein [Armatimonadetes bacterium]|nr:YlxR family protein [Armatimonadota bacterium]